MTSFLNRNKFKRIIAKYHGENYMKHFSCWNQLKVLMFGQLKLTETTPFQELFNKSNLTVHIFSGQQ